MRASAESKVAGVLARELDRRFVEIEAHIAREHEKRLVETFRV